MCVQEVTMHMHRVTMHVQEVTMCMHAMTAHAQVTIRMHVVTMMCTRGSNVVTVLLQCAHTRLQCACTL